MKRLLTGALALTLLTGTAAMAQPYGHDRHDNRNDQGGYNQDRGNGYNQDRGNGYNQDRGNGYNRDNNGGGHHWARGQRLPATYYRDRSHYIDYRAHHLRAPPRGYRWVQTDDNNYAMVAITSGLIASLIAANR